MVMFRGDYLLTIKEAADQCGVHEKTIRRRIQKGKLAAIQVEGKFGMEWMIPEEALDTDEHSFSDVQDTCPSSSEQGVHVSSDHDSSTKNSINENYQLISNMANQITLYKAQIDTLTQAIDTLSKAHEEHLADLRAERDRAIEEAKTAREEAATAREMVVEWVHKEQENKEKLNRRSLWDRLFGRR